MKFFIVLACALLSTKCSGSPMEDTVVSVYTTQSSTAGTNHSLDVYHQIANNIAERITSPIYRFLGYNGTTAATSETTTKRPWTKLELFDDQDLSIKKDIKPVDNDIAKDRDVEELSVEGLSKQDKKPEKFTLYSSLIPSYLPTKLETEATTESQLTTILQYPRRREMTRRPHSTLELNDDEETEKPREGPLIYIMELIGSAIQLLWGGFLSLFQSPSSNDTR